MPRASSPSGNADEAPAPAVRLRVARARPYDVGTGTARLGPGAFRRLGVAVGDVIELVGRRRTTAVALRLQFEDRGLDVVRIDGLVRANVGARIGEDVEVRRVVVSDALRVTLDVPRDVPIGPGVRDAVHVVLLGRVLSTGDLVPVDHPARHVRLGSSDDARPLPPVSDAAQVPLRVASTEPVGSVVVRAATEIDLRGATGIDAAGQRSVVTYDDVGGLADVIGQLRELVELPLLRPDLFRRLGIAPPRGIMLHGPAGSGKTLLAKAVAGEVGAHLVVVESAELLDASQGNDVDRALGAIFQRARELTPAMVLLENLETIAPARDTGGDRRSVPHLAALIDELGSSQHVVVIATARTPEAVNEALRRPGRFDREIGVRALDHVGRREVLTVHTRHVPLAPDVSLDQLAAATLGFTGADLSLLVREAAVAALRCALPARPFATSEQVQALVEPLEVAAVDFADALARVRPAALRERPVEIPSVRWADIGGLDQVKHALRDGIQLPLKHAEVFARLGIRASRGFLLFGPPGTGKTLLARAVANESGANFIAVRSSDLLSKWYGESERHVTQLFARARSVAPVILFFDEIDALVPRRGVNAAEPVVTERLVNAFLMEIDGLEQLGDVVVMGATNQPQLIDPALLRPGRIDELIYVPAPNDDERLHILRVLTARVPLAPDVDLRIIAGRTPGYTGADLEGLVRRAGFRAFSENADARDVRMAHLEQALRDTQASVTPEIRREFEQMLQTTGLRRGTASAAIGFVARDDAPSAS